MFSPSESYPQIVRLKISCDGQIARFFLSTLSWGLFPFSVFRSWEPVSPRFSYLAPSALKVFTFSAVCFSPDLLEIFHSRTLLGFSLQSFPLRKSRGISRYPLPSCCSYLARLAYCASLFSNPARISCQVVQLQGFAPFQSPFSCKRGLITYTVVALLGFRLSRVSTPLYSAYPLQSRSSSVVPSCALPLAFPSVLPSSFFKSAINRFKALRFHSESSC